MWEDKKEAGALNRRYTVPPFTVLDGRAGYWQDRKRQWLSLGIEGEAVASGRGANLAFNAGLTKLIHRAAKQTKDQGSTDQTWVAGTSVFDPVLTECLIEWFCPRGGQILDPFAGGSVRGVVATKLGRTYVGIELRSEQVIANEAQRLKVFNHPTPNLKWHCADSRQLLPDLSMEADFLLTCPPYGDLEVYSDAPTDLSAMSHTDFQVAYGDILNKACAKLKNDRFAAIVVADFRDKAGYYRDFVSSTIRLTEACGLRLYNEAVLVNPVGTLPLRVGGQMQASRKLGKCHQNVLVFVKGDPRAATTACLLNAPDELGYKDLPALPAVSRTKRSNASKPKDGRVAATLPQEIGTGDSEVSIENGIAIDAESGKLGG